MGSKCCSEKSDYNCDGMTDVDSTLREYLRHVPSSKQREKQQTQEQQQFHSEERRRQTRRHHKHGDSKSRKNKHFPADDEAACALPAEGSERLVVHNPLQIESKDGDGRPVDETQPSMERKPPTPLNSPLQQDLDEAEVARGMFLPLSLESYEHRLAQMRLEHDSKKQQQQ